MNMTAGGTRMHGCAPTPRQKRQSTIGWPQDVAHRLRCYFGNQYLLVDSFKKVVVMLNKLRTFLAWGS